MSKCKGKCWSKFLPHNWLCLKGLSIAFLVLFYITLIAGIVIAVILCGRVWDMFAAYLQVGGKELLSNGSLWMAWGAMLSQVILLTVPLMFVWLAFSKICKALAKIKHAVAPCCCNEEKAKETKKEAK